MTDPGGNLFGLCLVCAVALGVSWWVASVRVRYWRERSESWKADALWWRTHAKELQRDIDGWINRQEFWEKQARELAAERDQQRTKGQGFR